MLNIETKKGISEVLYILKYMDRSYTEKIPPDFFQFLKENSTEINETEIDFSQPIEELKVNQKTKELLALLYIRYWASPDEKSEFKEILRSNYLQHQSMINEKYSYKNIFKDIKENLEEDKQESTELMVINESLIKRIWNRIIGLFKNYNK